VSDTQDPQPDALSLEDVTRASQELATRPDAARVAAAFLELVQRWAAPSAVLSAVRDATAPAGYRLLPSLCAGSLTLGIEKTLARLGEDSPESLARPMLLRGEEVPGIRVRDNVVVPWWCEGDSGLLVLRGVPRPSRAGLAEALALVAASVWPRLLGSPAARIEELLVGLKQGAARLEGEVSRQVERLHATAAPPPAPPPAAPDPALTARVSKLEGELGTLAQAKEALARELETARRERETTGLDLAAARQQAENARRELEAAREECRVAERDLDATRRELQSPKRAPAVEAPADSAPAATDVDDATRAAIDVAIAAVRRTAFVPPLLRVSIEEVAALGGKQQRPTRKIGIALLDRDVVALEPVASELEAVGIEVRLAHQPEELALLLRSPDAATVDAVVCDVMSFRPDQNVAGLLRGWDKDRPGLAFYLSYDAQSSVELERARRTPMSLTAGHITRPLTSARLVETSENLAKRLGRTDT
jgi:hypothetical protein